MKPEALVPSRKTCIALKEAGFPQDTFFGWADKDGKDRLWDPTEWSDYTNGSEGKWIAAPTLGEILEQLRGTYWQLTLSEDGYYVFDYHNFDPIKRVGDSNPAEAAARLWVKVKEGR